MLHPPRHDPTTTPPSRRRRRRLASAVAGLVAATGLIISSASPAGAAPQGFSSPITGTLTLAPAMGTPATPTPLPPGVTMSGTHDPETGALTGNLSWPQSVVTLDNELVGEILATIKVNQVGAISGTIDPETGATTITAPLELHLVRLVTTTNPPTELGGGAACRFPMNLELTGTTTGDQVAVSDDDFPIQTPPGTDPCGSLSSLIIPELAKAGNAVDMSFSISATAAVVEQMYALILNRSADPDGLAYWVARLEAGTPRSTVARQLARSREGWSRAVADSYAITLDRQPDAAGSRYWTNALFGVQDQPFLIGRLLSSPEADAVARENYPGAASDNEAYVRHLYKRLLDRNGDAAGIAYWTARINATPNQAVGRVSVAETMYRSPESSRAVVIAAYTDLVGSAPSAQVLTDLTALYRSNGFNTNVLRGAIVASGAVPL